MPTAKLQNLLSAVSSRDLSEAEAQDPTFRASAGTMRCVVWAGTQTSDSMPPRLTAIMGIVSAYKARQPAFQELQKAFQHLTPRVKEMI